MSCLEVIAPGLLTTVQDLGRFGYAHLGVSASGAADPVSLRLGNLLVGNPEHFAGLEMTLAGGTFRFPEGACFALAGAEFTASLNGQMVVPWTTTEAPPGSVLRTGVPARDARAYLCIRGGIRVPKILGSASTHLLSRMGGVAGRALRRGDLLRIGRDPFTPKKRALSDSARARFGWSADLTRVLRVTPGLQWGRFGEAAHQDFLSASYNVTPEANRMGLRLAGPVLAVTGEAASPSQGVSCGCIQVTRGGQPVILSVEQQTTGGYPLIAAVISADLPTVGQLRPGDRVRFQSVTTDKAVALLREQENWLAAGDLFR